MKRHMETEHESVGHQEGGIRSEDGSDVVERTFYYA
jgi:hypothetical protein